jgi:hypothetical protein
MRGQDPRDALLMKWQVLLMVAMVVSSAVGAPSCVPLGGRTAIGCGSSFGIDFTGANDRPGLYEDETVRVTRRPVRGAVSIRT